jgi:asparagine synthase (glutamine-hydrolysing)
MSGIAGIIHFDGRPVEPGQIEAMTAAMHARGPDGINHWRKGNVALGQCMLRTTPESLEETQPLTNEDHSLALVMDGRVDNYEELRRELLGKGAVLRTRADAELVLRAYEVWGEDCPDRIVGECVFFIWDARRQRLFGARDAAGTRHFYYYQGNGWFAFASKIKALLTLPRIERRLNESRLLDFLVIEFDRDDEIGTLYQGVLRLPAGHSMAVTSNGPRAWRNWDPSSLPGRHFVSVADCTDAFIDQLRVVIKSRLRSTRPVGAMLSGGLDSSSIVGFISKDFRSDLTDSLRTFSMIRDDREHCSDWRCIDEILRNDPWLQPTILTSAKAEIHYEDFQQSISQADEPVNVLNGFFYDLIYKQASAKGCNAVFDGMAGDLLFYSPDRTMNSLVRSGRLTQLPAAFDAYQRHGLAGAYKDAVWAALGRMATQPMRAAWRRRRDEQSLARDDLRLLHGATARHLVHSRRRVVYERARHLFGQSEQQAHARSFTTGMLSFGHEILGPQALALGVEPRSPFSDRRMIEFSVQMPLEAKWSVPWYKHPLRTGTAGFLPDAVRWRADLGGHPGWTFFDRLVRQISRASPDGWSAESCLEVLGKWVDRDELERLWSRYKEGGEYHTASSVLRLFVAAQWMRENNL